jgi:hypothetical protein
MTGFEAQQRLRFDSVGKNGDSLELQIQPKAERGRLSA